MLACPTAVFFPVSLHSFRVSKSCLGVCVVTSAFLAAEIPSKIWKSLLCACHVNQEKWGGIAGQASHAGVFIAMTIQTKAGQAFERLGLCLSPL